MTALAAGLSVPRGPGTDSSRLGRMSAEPALSLPEWTVLAVVSEHPTHGFAIAQLTAPQGELGRIWHIPRPVIYRAIGRLLEAGLLVPGAVESGRGPQRTIYSATPAGREAVRHWLDTPVAHIREVRSHLLLKLALLDRAGGDPRGLLERQKAALEPIAEAVKAERPASEGFDATLLAWRRATTAATLSFLDDLTRATSSAGSR
jgi:DNA-binding PadR family transcriptional regulator